MQPSCRHRVLFTLITIIPYSASPEYGYSFDSWTSSSNSLGLLSSTTSIQPTFTLNGDVSFTGNFSENQYLLTVHCPGAGSGGASVSPSTPTLYYHSSQVPVNCTAAPLEGYEFDRWEDCTGSILDLHRSLTAPLSCQEMLPDVTVKASL